MADKRFLMASEAACKKDGGNIVNDTIGGKEGNRNLMVFIQSKWAKYIKHT